MVQIVTDSSVLYTEEEAKAAGFDVVPLCVSVGDMDGRDLQINMEEFYGRIGKGEIPRSSQPPIGDVVEVYEKYQDADVLNICVADGLSGDVSWRFKRQGYGGKPGPDHRVQQPDPLRPPQVYGGKGPEDEGGGEGDPRDPGMVKECGGKDGILSDSPGLWIFKARREADACGGGPGFSP